MEIKTIEQIKKGLAKHYGYSDWLDMLRNSGDWSHDMYINEIAKEYASQFQANNDIVTAEICAMRERVAELEDMLMSVVRLQDKYFGENDVHRALQKKAFEIESLINKGKDNEEI